MPGRRPAAILHAVSQRQLSLPFQRVPDPDLARRRAQVLANDLQARLGARVTLAITDNRASLVTVRYEKGAWLYRVHHMFLGADAATCEALAFFATGRRKKTAGRQLDAFIEAHQHLIREDPASGPRAPAPPRGRHHDLQAIYDRLNDEYFAGKVVARIGWGEHRRGRSRRRRRSIKMGSYVHDARLIRIHPALDRPEVPEYYLAWVVYHEMLHQVVPPVRRGSRTVFHPPAFRELERAYRQADIAQAWEDAHFDLLLEG